MNHVVQLDAPPARASEGDAVLEVELSAQDLLRLSQRPPPGTGNADAVIKEDTEAPRITPADLRVRPSHETAAPNTGWPRSLASVAIGAPILVAAVAAAFVVYQGSAPKPVQVSARASAFEVPQVAAPPAVGTPTPPPVRFANPFDRTEIFEFPAGTSRGQARDRVAILLRKRAQERRHPYERVAVARLARTATR